MAGGWAYIDGKPIPMYQKIEGESRRTFRYKPGDVHDWAHPEDAEAVVFPQYNWWNNILGIASIDRENRITMQEHYLRVIDNRFGKEILARVPEMERDVTGLEMIEKVARGMFGEF